MELIDKEKVMAEIERRLEALANTSAENNRHFAAIIGAQHYELINLAAYISTLETKEVDFENEWKEYFKYRGNVATVNIKELARHFFELGLKYKK